MEVFNILFVTDNKKHLVYCQDCARKTSANLEGFIVLNQVRTEGFLHNFSWFFIMIWCVIIAYLFVFQYTIEELTEVFNNFKLHTVRSRLIFFDDIHICGWQVFLLIILILRRLSFCARTLSKHLSTKEKQPKNKNETKQNNNKTKTRADQRKLPRTQEWNSLIASRPNCFVRPSTLWSCSCVLSSSGVFANRRSNDVPEFLAIRWHGCPGSLTSAC